MTQLETSPDTTPAPPAGPRIDAVMPVFDVNLVQHVVVNADPQQTYAALLDADLMDNGLTRLLVRARDLPNVVRRTEAAKPAERPTFRIRDAAGADSGWVLLGDVPGSEYLVGLVGRFWERGYGIVQVSADEFAGFDRPGYAKTLAGFSMRPYGSGRTLLSYESRTGTTDPNARRRFSLYWLILRPFVRQLLRGALVAVKRGAEHRASGHPATSYAPLVPQD